LAIAFVALLRSAILRERGAWIIAFIIALQLWLDGTTRSITPFEVLGTRTWTGGVAFGPRKFVDVLPLLLPATISLVQAARQRGWGTKLAVLAIALTIPTVAMHVAAFADPRATTGQVLDWSGYGHRIVAGLTLAGLHEAAAARSLPIAVGLVLGVFVGLPTAAAGILGYRRWSQLGGKHRGRVGATIVLGAAASAHVWTTVLLVRSDRLLAEDPQRMVAAARTFNPNHLATVQTIERHHAELRAKLGDSAAP
jgi:hypothetical protein